jgi:branched-chain amino acid transport system ATP-binding protein
MSPVLEARDVTKRFGGITAVDSISFSLGGNRILGVVGPNGAGKTALLNCLSGVYALDAGSVYFNGNPIHHLRPHAIAALGVARTFQSTEHLAEMKVFEYVLVGVTRRQAMMCVAYGLRMPSAIRLERAERARAAGVLDSLGLGAYYGARLREVPYGVQKRIDLGRVIASRPVVVLLDEPTSGANAQDRADVESAIVELAQRDIAMIIIDHDVGFVRKVCQELLVMDHGRMLAYGEPESVLQRPDVRQAYLGSTLDETSSEASLDREGVDRRPDSSGDG